jgi:hypothetical protein
LEDLGVEDGKILKKFILKKECEVQAGFIKDRTDTSTGAVKNMVINFLAP